MGEDAIAGNINREKYRAHVTGEKNANDIKLADVVHQPGEKCGAIFAVTKG